MSVVLVIVFEILEAMLPDKMGIISYLLSGAEMMFLGQMQIANPSLLQTFALGILATQLIKNSSNIATQIVKSYGTSIGDGLDSKISKGLQGMGKVGAAVGGAAVGMLEGGMDAIKKGATGVSPKAGDLWGASPGGGIGGLFGAGPKQVNGKYVDAITGKTEADNRSEMDLVNSGMTQSDINAARRNAAKENPSLFYYDERNNAFVPKAYADPAHSEYYTTVEGYNEDKDKFTFGSKVGSTGGKPGTDAGAGGKPGTGAGS